MQVPSEPVRRRRVGSASSSNPSNSVQSANTLTPTTSISNYSPRLTGADAFLKQCAIITGQADPMVRVAAIRPGHQLGEEWAPARHVEKSGQPHQLYAEFTRLADDGYNIYLRMQPLRDLADGKAAEDTDVTSMRCAYADGDETPLPAEFHAEPSYVAHNPETRRWQAAWTVAGGTVADIRPVMERLAHHYGTDKKVINESRLMRAVGFPRWKTNPETKALERFAAYELEVFPASRATVPADHYALPAPPPRATLDRLGPSSNDVISEGRLIGLLVNISPADRDAWRCVVIAMSEGKVINEKLEVLEQHEVYLIADRWSSGELHTKHPGPKLPRFDVGNYVGPDDVAVLFYGRRRADSDPHRVTFGSVVHLAKEHATEQGKTLPTELSHRGFEVLHGKFVPVVQLNQPPVNDNAAAQPSQATSNDNPSAQPERRGMRAVFLEDEAEEPIEWLVEGLLPRKGVVSLSAPPGRGKSTLKDELKIGVATRGVFCGRQVLTDGVILDLVLEDRGNVPVRLRSVCSVMGVDIGQLRRRVAHNPKGVSIKLPRDLGAVQQMIADVEAETGLPVAAVTVDTIREALVGSVSDEKDLNPFLDALKVIGEERCVVALGHMSAECAKLPLPDRRPKGGTETEDRADGVLLMDMDKAANTATIWVRKMKSGPAQYAINFALKPATEGIVGLPVPVYSHDSDTHHDMHQHAKAAKGKQEAAAELFQNNQRAKDNAERRSRQRIMVDTCLVQVLRSNPTRRMSTSQLAEAIAQKDINIQVRTITDLLKEIGLNSEFEGKGCYNPVAPNTDRWSWEYGHPSAPRPAAEYGPNTDAFGDPIPRRRARGEPTQTRH